MSGTSELGGRIVYDSSLLGANHKPVGSISSRNVVTNNINHYQDIFAQQRINWSARALGSGQNAVITTAATTMTQVMSTAPFPIAVRPDGTSYRIRLSVACAIDSVSTVGHVAVVLAPVDYSREVLVNALAQPLDAGSDAVWYATFTGTTPAYKTGSSQGPQAWTRMVGLVATDVGGYTVPVSGLVDIAGNATSREACMVSLTVFLKTENAADDVFLYAVNAAEWYG